MGFEGEPTMFPTTPDIALKSGFRLLGVLLKDKYPKEKQHTVLIGKDTRLSGYMLEQALASGLNSMGSLGSTDRPPSLHRELAFWLKI